MNQVKNITQKTTLKSTAKIVTLMALSCSLVACYVVPVNQYGQPQYPVSNNTGTAPAVAYVPAPMVTVLNAKLYPANDTAAPFGALTGSVTNHLNGRGEIVVVQGDETFRGEATRNAGNSRSGQANGAGNRGGYMSCEYTMNSSTQGTGTCKFNNGAVYKFHLAQ